MINTRLKTCFKTFYITLALLLLIIPSFYIYKNMHTAITLNGEQTKAFIFKGIAYDVERMRPFDGTMSYVRKNIKYKVNVRDGKLSGKIMGYYPNGNLKSMQISKKSNGCSFFYYENGNLEAKYCFKNGQLDGIQQVFYENGNRKVQFFLKNGQLDGIQQVFYENGNLKTQSYFQDDEPVRYQFWYRENGILWYEINNDADTIVEFDEKGNFVKSITSDNDLKEVMQRLKEMGSQWIKSNQ